MSKLQVHSIQNHGQYLHAQKIIHYFLYFKGQHISKFLNYLLSTSEFEDDSITSLKIFSGSLNAVIMITLYT